WEAFLVRDTLAHQRVSRLFPMPCRACQPPPESALLRLSRAYECLLAHNAATSLATRSSRTWSLQSIPCTNPSGCAFSEGHAPSKRDRLKSQVNMRMI